MLQKYAQEQMRPAQLMHSNQTQSCVGHQQDYLVMQMITAQEAAQHAQTYSCQQALNAAHLSVQEAIPT